MCFLSQIEKFGDPNGIVQFTEDALHERVYNESTEAEGPFNISLSVTRREGVMGNITVILHQHTFITYQSHPVSVIIQTEFFVSTSKPYSLSYLRYIGRYKVTQI